MKICSEFKDNQGKNCLFSYLYLILLSCHCLGVWRHLRKPGGCGLS